MTTFDLHNNTDDNSDLNKVGVSGVDIIGNDESRNQRNDGDDNEDKNKNVVDLVPDLLKESFLLLLGELVLPVLGESFLRLGGGKTNLSDIGREVELLDGFFHRHGVPEWRVHGDRCFVGHVGYL